MKHLLSAFLILMVLVQTAAADDATRVQEDLESKLDAVLGIVKQEDLDSQAKQDRVAEVLEPLFDFALMSKLALGKTQWSAASEGDRNRFTDLFTRRLKESYLTKLDLLTNEKITFETPTQEGNKIQIPTHVVTQDDNLSVIWKFYKMKDDWKIYDVEIEGVSLISSYRSQFNETLQDGTFEELLKKLEEKE
jgi:phospholipid transport system substrate-binding protein